MNLALGTIEQEAEGEEGAIVRRKHMGDVNKLEELNAENALLHDQSNIYRANLHAADSDLYVSAY
jgi:hypothetical protein